MPTTRHVLMPLVALAALAASTSAQLSIPNPDDTDRAATVEATSLEIANVPRSRLIGDTIFPLNEGPELKITSPPSLYAAKTLPQLQTIKSLGNPNTSAIVATLQAAGPYASPESFQAGYAALETAGLIETPQSFDNSDEAFAATRLSFRGYNMKLVRRGEWSDPLDDLSDELVYEQCGVHKMKKAINNHLVFVSDFSTLGQFTDTNTTESKYTPSVVGFFCNKGGPMGQLLPLSIQIVDTGLTYTKYDSEGEWQLAKMALDATEFNFVTVFHFVHSHLVLIPVQVELMRSLAVEHPVYALLDYHFFGNFALEYLAQSVLLSPATPFDQALAFGATGSLRYVFDKFPEASLATDLPADIQNNGLYYLPKHRYVKYGTKYYNIVRKFVDSYVHTYYPSARAIRDDTELQTWAKRTSAVNGVHGFPQEFRSFQCLVKLLSNLIFQNAVKHHFLNGRVTWHSQGAPYSPAALYNTPLPTEKGVDVNPLDYAIPSDLFPVMSALTVGFTRDIPLELSALQAYTSTPFVNEPELEKPIAKFHKAMQKMEELIDKHEAKETYPFDFIKPSLLPWFSFI